MTAKIAPMGAPPKQTSRSGSQLLMDAILSDDVVPSGESHSRRYSQVKQSPRALEKVKNNPLMQFLYKGMMGKRWTIFISAITIFALFGDDIRVSSFPKSIDTIFFSISLVGMLAFTAELVVFTVAKPGYYRGFYFWLDIIATITMISDIGFIWEPLLAIILSDDGTKGNSQDAIDAIQASRVGTKSSRIVRIVRLVRLVRMVKLYKMSSSNKSEEEHEVEENPTLVGKKLSDRTMQRVITIVLSMLVFVQFFDVGMWEPEKPHGTFGIVDLHLQFQEELWKRDNVANYTSSGFDEFFEGSFKEHVQLFASGVEGGRLLFFSIHGASPLEHQRMIEFARSTTFVGLNGISVTTNDDDYTPAEEIHGSAEGVRVDFRSSEYTVAFMAECYDPNLDMLDPNSTDCSSFAYFDIREQARVAAVLNISQTVFVMIVLTFGSMMISADAEHLVIKPIERMVHAVKSLAENPMGISLELEQQNSEDQDETVLLHNTITKIGQLLQIGFGDAGSEIIAKNMSNNSRIEPLCDGVKMNAIFGFCDIRNFTDTTECLQENVMVYVNKVGAIVHEATHAWHGAANKNIGDAFLLVWKVKEMVDAKQKLTMANIDAGNMSDNALVAFLKSIVDLKRENGPGGCLHEYKRHPAILKRFGEGNFEIRLGMGLHIGWAIEGAIGSKYKIDASYLSPNVNMAARLEAATKQFRTPLLLSGDFYDSLSARARRRCRLIDRVTVKGSEQPMGLYTCDIVNFPESFGEPKYDDQGNRLDFDFDGSEMNALQEDLPQNFLNDFSGAVSHYLAGDWPKAQEELESLLEKKPKDGPSLSLLKVLEKHNFKAPNDWRGFRELTEK